MDIYGILARGPRALPGQHTLSTDSSSDLFVTHHLSHGDEKFSLAGEWVSSMRGQHVVHQANVFFLPRESHFKLAVDPEYLVHDRILDGRAIAVITISRIVFIAIRGQERLAGVRIKTRQVPMLSLIEP